MGTTVTCPTLRYNPAVVAEAFATLSQLYPGRVFLGVGSGEALNEQAATGAWPKWQERWDRLIEGMTIIRQLWTGENVSFKGKYYTVEAKLYDPPPKPIPLLTAANGKKSMRLAGQHGDGLVSDPQSWKKWKSEWEAGARDAGKNPADMPVLIEHYAVVGDQAAAKQAAEYWRFGPKAWKSLYDVRDPAAGRTANPDRGGAEILGRRHRSRGACRYGQGTVRQWRHHRQHPFRPAGSEKSDRILRFPRAAEIQAASVTESHCAHDKHDPCPGDPRTTGTRSA
jgi:alkanesulfonate monooxygenase SsuD/methylene tetrahydromethanopterin reductase-like flavin-dependent oxidoreductase (luciferase family)